MDCGVGVAVGVGVMMAGVVGVGLAVARAVVHSQHERQSRRRRIGTLLAVLL